MFFFVFFLNIFIILLSHNILQSTRIVDTFEGKKQNKYICWFIWMIKKYFVSICTYKYTHRYMCLQMDIHYKYIHTYRYTYLQMAKYIYNWICRGYNWICRGYNWICRGNLDVWRVAVCVRFSSETTRPISPMMIPINWENNVDVQRTLYFDFDPSMTAGQGHEILWFGEFRCVWRVAVCVRFSSETTRPISPMMIPINWENNVDVQRTLHFDLDPSMAAGQCHEILRFCEFRCLTGSSLCSLLLRNYSTDFSNDDTNQLS